MSYRSIRRRNRQSTVLMESIEGRLLLSTTLTTLASFPGSGIAQGGTVIDSHGDIFGVTQATNTAYGTLYELPAGSNTIQTLVLFTGNDGSNPNSSLLIDSAGNIYGTTSAGGTSGFGTVWELPAGATSITRLASYNGIDGNQLGNGLARSANGNIFVVALGGSNGNGAVLELPAGSGALSVVDELPSGSQPLGRPVLDSAGDLFGVTYSGASGSGSIYEIAANGDTETLAAFANATPNPQGDLLIDSAGNLFGVTASTANGQNISTVWEYQASTGNILTLATDTAPDGTYIEAGLARDSTGDLFYATTGAVGDPSTIFKIPSSGGAFGPSIALASIPEDDINGANDVAATGYLSLDSFGDLFGTTQSFDFNTPDTIFEINGAGSAQVASQLAISQQPTTAIVNNFISPSITVAVEDSNSNLVASSTAPVSVRISSGPSGAKLNGTLSVNAVAGVATFSNLNINIVGNYTLIFSAPGMSTASSISFKISKDPHDGSHLVFTLPPAPTTAAGNKMQEFIVTAEQPNDAVSSTTKGTVTLSLINGPTNGKILGVKTAILKKGVAVFSRVSFNIAGTYSMQATDIPSIAATPVMFQITATTPKKAIFSAQPPVKISAGQTFSLAVELKDKYGNIATSDNSSVMLTLVGGPRFSALAGTNNQDVIDGIAGFDDLSVINPGRFTIKAVDASDNLKITSRAFRIT